MCVTFIDKYKGRFGNNIFQIVCACHFAFVKNNCKEIRIPKETFEKKIFTDDVVLYNNSNDTCYCENKLHYKNNRFNDFDDYIKNNNLTLYDIKQLIKKHLVVNRRELTKCSANNENVIHIRSGDVSNVTSGQYARRSNTYYDELIKQFGSNTLIVCEDYKSPSIQYLQKTYPSLRFQSIGKWEDLSTLVNSQNMGLSVGTFGLTAYLLSDKIKTIYIDKTYKYFPKLGNDPNVKFIKL
tara:strand:- start:125 stop:841 length:717 start_codon:yes stop_codon:yes gene_type:complete